MYEQLYEYLKNYSNDLLCGFRTTHSSQHALFRLIQSWKREQGNSGLLGKIIMDLSKVYDYLPYDLLKVKSEGYGLDKPGLNLVNDYLRFENKGQKLALHIVTRLMLLGVFPKVFTSGIFFADDNTLFSCGDNITVISKSLMHDVKILLRWFKLLHLKPIQKNFNL